MQHIKSIQALGVQAQHADWSHGSKKGAAQPAAKASGQVLIRVCDD